MMQIRHAAIAALLFVAPFSLTTLNVLPDELPAACRSCVASHPPERGPGNGAWQDWTRPVPLGIVISFTPDEEGGIENGQCKPPASCAERKCRYTGKFEIYNGGTFGLHSAQIFVDGSGVTDSGSLAMQTSRFKEHLPDAPLAVACTDNKENEKVVKFQISWSQGSDIASSTLTLKCGKCGVAPPSP